MKRILRASRIVFLALMILFIISYESLSANDLSPDDGFASYLLENGEYYRAITEYMRLLYSDTDDSRKLYYRRQIGLSYYFGSDYDGLISYVEENHKAFQSDPNLSSEMELYLGKGYYNINNYYKAISTFEWSGIEPDDPYYDELQFMLGVSYARIFDWQTAHKYMNQVDSSSPRKKKADQFLDNLAKAKKLPKRNKWLAGIFSAIIPGTGYLYCNHRGTALNSLLINGILIWSIVDSINQKQYGLGSAAAFFAMGWYMGNIKGSMTAAERYNAHVRNQFIDKILDQEDLFQIPRAIRPFP